MDDFKKIARTISIIENHLQGYEDILLHLPETYHSLIVGITGAPGSGKSTITDKLIKEIVDQNKTVAVLCIDPSSPFNMGALLGDRIRMSDWYTHKNVFIRSFATRKALGGLCPMIVEITEYLKTTGFDLIIIETVGVGQTEIDIAGLADITIVNLTPETGDEIQTMKSGIIEIADIFVVNKSDKPGADMLIKNLHSMLAPQVRDEQIPIVKTIANIGTGIDELYKIIEEKAIHSKPFDDKKCWLLAEKAYHIIQLNRMKNLDTSYLFEQIKKQTQNGEQFNLYRFVQGMLT
jgi:LAO/AO transport system kinase